MHSQLKIFTFCLLTLITTLNCISKNQNSRPTHIHEEGFIDKNTLIITGIAVSPSDLTKKKIAKLYQLKNEARFNAQNRAKEICIGHSMVTCGHNPAISTELKMILSSKMKMVREECIYESAPIDATGCKIQFEIKHGNIEGLCNGNRQNSISGVSCGL